MIDNSLDGKNREAVLIEFGTRLHRTIYEHVQQFTFNSAGDHKIAVHLYVYINRWNVGNL